MKKLIILSAFLFCFTIISCNESVKENAVVNKEDAIEYNDFLATSIDPVITKMLDFEEALFVADNEKIKALYAELISITLETRKKISERPAFDGNETFKNSLLEIMNFYTTVAEKDYSRIIQLIESENELSQEVSDKIEEILTTIYDRENEYYINFEKEVSLYAKKYNLEVNELNESY
ncbi:MAG: hypothetical protein H0V01_03130 [Bacteroidetes bacterium]|nr:hypothetical protein [Bacteroidota bacterium]HET6244908.1 hypothetical protein [Bacteroidia bacterium]